MYIDVTVKHDRLLSISHELEEERLSIWIENQNGKLYLTFRPEDLRNFKKEFLALSEELEVFYKNDHYVKEGVENENV